MDTKVVLGLVLALAGGARGVAVRGGTTSTPDPTDRRDEYSFAYSVQDPRTGDSKQQAERRQAGGVVLGTYSLLDADGAHRTVEYSADPVHGFTAVVRRNPAGAALFVKAPPPAPEPRVVPFGLPALSYIPVAPPPPPLLRFAYALPGSESGAVQGLAEKEQQHAALVLVPSPPPPPVEEDNARVVSVRVQDAEGETPPPAPAPQVVVTQDEDEDDDDPPPTAPAPPTAAPAIEQRTPASGTPPPPAPVRLVSISRQPPRPPEPLLKAPQREQLRQPPHQLFFNPQPLPLIAALGHLGNLGTAHTPFYFFGHPHGPPLPHSPPPPPLPFPHPGEPPVHFATGPGYTSAVFTTFSNPFVSYSY